jgi:Cu2+-exporting ATPase
VWVAVSVLVVTCPCALSLAAPAALLAAAGALARRGVLVHRLDALEALAGIDTVCFDKTGTLTRSQLDVAAVELQLAAREAGLDAAAALALAASLAGASNHPLARAVVAAAPPAPAVAWQDARESPGEGVEAFDAGGRRYRLGSRAWAVAGGGTAAASGPSVWLAGPQGALACLRFEESLHTDAGPTVDALRADGLEVRLLSGDATARVRAVAGRLGIEAAEGDATPADKLAAVAALQRRGHRVAMVGDGLNDAPVMARADVSFAIGDGSALTRSGADFILLSGALGDIVRARRTARRTLRVVRQNIGWAIAYNATCVPLALAGWFPPWAAGLGMAASSVLVVLNALRIDRGASLSSAAPGGLAP